LLSLKEHGVFEFKASEQGNNFPVTLRLSLRHELYMRSKPTYVEGS